LKLKSLKIVSELKRGEPFGRMNALYSAEPLKSHDGLLGEFEKGALNTELDMAISRLEEGEVSDPVWTKEGFYILKLVRKIQASYVPLGQVREQIYRALYQQKREKAFDDWLRALWEKAAVSIKK
jgi:parvulin-like peptidyl-prolyl isomerase